MLCKLQHNLAWVGAKLGHAFNCTWSMVCPGRQLRPCSFSSPVLWISLRSATDDLLYRLNCHVDKQPALGDLFFTRLWIATNNSRWANHVITKERSLCLKMKLINAERIWGYLCTASFSTYFTAVAEEMDLQNPRHTHNDYHMPQDSMMKLAVSSSHSITFKFPCHYKYSTHMHRKRMLPQVSNSGVLLTIPNPPNLGQKIDLHVLCIHQHLNHPLYTTLLVFYCTL